jgi:hypothetical protein
MVSLLAATLLAAIGLYSRPAGAFELQTDQNLIEDLQRRSDLDVSNPMAVFGEVFAALPAKMTVYPTESYYYFFFLHNGVRYEGNIRFDAADQFDGRVHFAYFREYTLWSKPGDPIHRKLGPAEGVKVEQLNKFAYRITYQGRSVEFDLPDLSNVKPPEGALLKGEVYLGPIIDESGVQFYLIFNRPAKTFLYVLNEEAPSTDDYRPASFSKDVTVGVRTSFAFLKDKSAPRKILIGVFGGNAEVNNMLDGPFDQLPDNYIKGEALRDALLTIGPWMKGKIDRYGSAPDGSERYAITAYVYYDQVEDLRSVLKCTSSRRKPAQYYACFKGEDGEDQRNAASPARAR